MNILFYINETLQPEKGGIHRVTDVLIELLSKEHNVYCLMAVNDESRKLDEGHFFYLPNPKYLLSPENINYANRLISLYSIKVLINQDGISPLSSIFPLSLDNNEIKVVTVVHNTLTSIYGAKGHVKSNYEQNMPKLFYQLLDKIIKFYFKSKYAKYWDLVINKSAKIVMLSASLEKNLSIFLGKEISEDKVTSIPNPVTLRPSYSHEEKEKRVLFVGRLSYEKQPLLLLKIWEKVIEKKPDWKLDIVGDGKLLNDMKLYVANKNIKGVAFYGKQDPKKYYERSSIFCMTSAFEGLPLVILEAMAFGVVPFAFDSFITAKDLIQSEKNGILIKPYDLDAYVRSLTYIMEHKELLSEMRMACKNKVQQYSLSTIVKKWNLLFNEVLSDNE